MIYKGINIRRIEKTPGPIWKLCGSDEDYGLFETIYPRDLAIFLIHQVFSDEQIKGKRFVYLPHTYRGRNSMKDTIDVYFKIEL